MSATLDHDLGEAAHVLAQGGQCGAAFENVGEPATVGLGETVGSGDQPPGDLPDGRRVRWCRPRPVFGAQRLQEPADGLGAASVAAFGDFRSEAGGVGAPGGETWTDTIDARHLARLLHLGQIVGVTVPSVEQEAARDLVRAREDCRGDLMSARHRISKLLLRQWIVYFDGHAWTQAHDGWLRAQHFDPPALQRAYDSACDAMLATVDRRDRLDAAIETIATDSDYTPVVTRLACLRGVSTLTAFGLALEIGDWQRLTGRSIGAYLGLVPTEHSSGAARSQGSITKTATVVPGACWSRPRGTAGPGICRE